MWSLGAAVGMMRSLTPVIRIQHGPSARTVAVSTDYNVVKLLQDVERYAQCMHH